MEEIKRSLFRRLKEGDKNILLFGPRQVGKSTLCRSLKPDLTVNLADEASYLSYSKDASRIKREVAALTRPSSIFIDEVQRVPALLNTIQSILDDSKRHRFILTGSSARKLKRGGANLLPGRVLLEHLDALSIKELGGRFDLEKALRVGTLPGIYLDDKDGPAILETYASTYLREEIQAEALSKNLGAYARF